MQHLEVPPVLVQSEDSAHDITHEVPCGATAVKRTVAALEQSGGQAAFLAQVASKVGQNAQPTAISLDPEDVARYVIAVSFESVAQEIAVYEPLRVAVQELQAELETEVELEAEVEVEE